MNKTKSEDKPINSVEIGRAENGRFKEGNNGKPKGAVNKTTKDLRDFIIKFLNDKAFELPHLWDTLDDKDKASLYLHLCKIVIPKQIKEDEPRKEIEPIVINFR